MKLWITGKDGLLGAAFSAKCKAALHLKTGREVDIADPLSVETFVKKNPGITHIVNCAAFSQVDASEYERAEAHRVNARGPELLACAAQEMGAKLVHFSTDYVFPGHCKRPLTEKDPVGPCNYYGQTKLEGEQRVLALSACVIRTSWLFGSAGKNFVSRLFQMLQTQKVIRLTDDQWGRFTYAPDLVEAVLRLLDHQGLYQYANAGITTKYEFGLAMRDEAIRLGFPVMAESILPIPSAAFPTPCNRPVYSAFDTTKIEPFAMIRDWRKALRDFLCAQLPVYS